MMNYTRSETCIFHYVCNMIGCKTCKNFKPSRYRLRVLKEQKHKRKQEQYSMRRETNEQELL